MKASFQWLRSLVPQIPGDPDAFADRLTAAGLEVEGIHHYGAGIDPCEVVAVLSIRPHPSKSGLRLVTVDRGASGTLEVICGAPNVPDPGGLVVLAPLGTTLPAKGMTIERRAIAGVMSEGMLCSESELGLTEESAGILALPAATAKAGTRFIDAVPTAKDVIFELGLTPNRADCLGHVGLAREAAALYGTSWQAPTPESPLRSAASGAQAKDLVKVTIEDTELCPHYAAAVLTEVAPGPSPLAIRYRLAALGVRSISNLVDLTNLVMLEYGHPMHAFDLDRLRGGAHIIVRRAKAGEKLRTLDGIDRTLDVDDLVICDGAGPLALAGVMGGGDSEISTSTKRVLLECAVFDSRAVRRAARRHGLHTESSHRFERGVDHGDSLDVLAHAVSLASRIAGGVAASGTVLAVGRVLERVAVTLRAARMNALLGIDVPFEEAVGTLQHLGFEVRASGTQAGVAECLVPTHRPDISREVDLIEEVGRVRGYDAIPAQLPAIRPSREVGRKEEIAQRARAAAVALGLSEAVTLGFVSAKALLAVFAPPPSVILRNPLTETQSVMRTSLLPGILDVLKRARRHGVRDVRAFTVGRVFLRGTENSNPPSLPSEPVVFAAVLAGCRPAYLTRAEAIDVWDAKGTALAFVERFVRRTPDVRALVSGDAALSRPGHLHPRGAGVLEVAGTVFGTFGLLHPDVVDALDLDGPAAIVEIDLELLATLAPATTRYSAIPRFPLSTRDMAFIVHDDVAAGDVALAVRAAAGPLAEHVEIFDRFVGDPVPANHANLAFRIVYRAADRTLTDAEVDAQNDRVKQELGARFGATIRA
jgi:phenylalanyl-tRNA synthetase beta chain